MRKINVHFMLSITAFSLALYLFGALALRASAAPTASAGDIIINEIMNNPSLVSDNVGEWIEIVNLTGSDIDINGWVLSDDGTDSHTISGAPVVPAVGFYVMCRDADFGVNGGVTCDYDYGGASGTDFQLGQGDDEVVLTEGVTEIARITYDNGATFPDPNGGSMAYSVPNGGGGAAAENNTGANWADSSVAPQSTQYNGTDFGTPGAINHDWNPTAVSLQSVS
ncbi:MAG: lamin tail domain-containing protein, partial [Anaerolineales bacterium]|nr:lamin tail domain-containing protein [Anaerolineales bacterium]